MREDKRTSAFISVDLEINKQTNDKVRVFESSIPKWKRLKSEILECWVSLARHSGDLGQTV
jgi:hypothetical protein